MIDERYLEDRERRRLGSLTVYSGPTHSGKTKKLEADAQQYDDRLIAVANDLATLHRVDVVIAGWELDYTGHPAGPMPELLCTADFAQKLDDGVCAQSGCRNLASRTQRFFGANGDGMR